MIRPMTGHAPALAPMLTVDRVGKTFTMHLQGGQRLAVLDDLSFAVEIGRAHV